MSRLSCLRELRKCEGAMYPASVCNRGVQQVEEKLQKRGTETDW
jgi:hypothetical protein